MIIEECGTGGTSRGRFTRRRDAAWVSWDAEHRVATLTSAQTHWPIAEIDTGYLVAHDAETGEYLGKGSDWHEVVKVAMGPHAYGYGWYQVKGKNRRYVPQEAR